MELKTLKQALENKWPTTTFEITARQDGEQQTGWTIAWEDGPAAWEVICQLEQPAQGTEYSLQPKRTLSDQGAAYIKIRQLKNVWWPPRITEILQELTNSENTNIENPTDKETILATLLLDWLGATTLRYGLRIKETTQRINGLTVGEHYMLLRKTAQQLTKNHNHPKTKPTNNRTTDTTHTKNNLETKLNKHDDI